MINYYSEDINFTIEKHEHVSDWINQAIKEEEAELGEINYIFCSDEHLHGINLKFLKHDTLTDIISFDYSVGKNLSGDIFISIPRVKENAHQFNTTFKNELFRVMIHGVLHFCGYGDKTKAESELMRRKEDYYLVKL